MERTHFSVTWDKYHSNMCAGLSLLQQNGELVDLTLAADGHLVKVHQIVLGVASSYIKELIQSADCKHPVIFMNNVPYKTLCSILEYVYMGEVSVEEENLEDFLNTAKTLQIKGIDEMYDCNEHPNIQVVESTLNLPSSAFKKYRLDIINNKVNTLTEEVQLPVYAKNVQIKRDHPSAVSPAQHLKKIKMSPKPSGTQKKDSRSQSPDDNPIQNDTETHPDSDHEFGPSHHDDQSDDEPDCTKKDSQEDKDVHAPKVDLKFTLSNMGGLQLILNRYVYSLRHYRKEHGSVRKWQCVDHRHRRCPAIAITDNDMVIRRKNLHNHPYHDKRILMKIEKKAVFSTIRTAENNVELVQER